MTQFKQDRMTEKERFEALLKRQPVDRVPFNLFALSYCSVNVGDPKLLWFDPEKSFEAMRRTHEMYGGWHWVFFTPGRFGIREFGGETKMPAGEYDHSATVLHSPVQSEEDVWNLKVPDVAKAGGIPAMIRYSRLQEKYGWPITFISGSILNRVGYIAGVEKMCRWMLKKPELVHRLARVVADFHIAVAQYWVDTFGHPERIIPFTAAPTESNQIISPRHFKEFCLPYQQEVHEKILAMGIRHINIHICGEQNLNLPYWTQIPRGDPGLVSFGHEIELDTAFQYFPNDVVMGNVEPSIIQMGPPEKIYELSKVCIEKGKKHQGGFAFGPSCELPPKAPPYNVWVMRKAINDFGWYE